MKFVIMQKIFTHKTNYSNKKGVNLQKQKRTQQEKQDSRLLPAIICFFLTKVINKICRIFISDNET